MAELRERLEALERRMERAEAALRERPLAALRLHGVSVLFEDVAVRFSRQEWASLDEGQRELYRSVMEGNYEMLVALYCALSKPELLLQLEREELSMPPESQPEESGNLMEESGSPVVPENCSTCECLANPAAAARGPGSLPGCSSPTSIAALALTAPVPLKAAAVLADLGQPTPSPPCLLSMPCQEAVGQSCSPPAAAGAEVGIPWEAPQEEVAAEKPSMPKTPSTCPEVDKGPQEKAVKDSGNTGRDLVANIPEEPGKEVTPEVCRMTEQADSCPGELENCVGRPAACQRNAARKFYSCPICRKTFLLKINLLIHQRDHNNWVPYVCVHCDRKFKSKKKIRRHLRAWAANGTCQPSELEVCPSQVPCPASHPQSWAANGTCQASKPEELWQEPGPARCSLSPGKMMYTCNECLETFSSQGFLTVHQRRHSVHHLILCPCCNRSFTWVSDFVRQHWTHMGVRPHQCGICQKTFKRFSHLKSHQKIHRRQERQFPRSNPVPITAAPA
ncbi:ZN543 protein, partial [Picathartes gymnocephalus]|nr:ZN543 protein [Picathartes gymnocephalus]